MERSDLIKAVQAGDFIPVTEEPYPQGVDFLGLHWTEEDGFDHIMTCLDDGSGTTGLEKWVTHWFPIPSLNVFYGT